MQCLDTSIKQVSFSFVPKYSFLFSPLNSGVKYDVFTYSNLLVLPCKHYHHINQGVGKHAKRQNVTVQRDVNNSKDCWMKAQRWSVIITQHAAEQTAISYFTKLEINVYIIYNITKDTMSGIYTSYYYPRMQYALRHYKCSPWTHLGLFVFVYCSCFVSVSHTYSLSSTHILGVEDNVPQPRE